MLSEQNIVVCIGQTLSDGKTNVVHFHGLIPLEYPLTIMDAVLNVRHAVASCFYVRGAVCAFSDMEEEEIPFETMNPEDLYFEVSWSFDDPKPFLYSDNSPTKKAQIEARKKKGVRLWISRLRGLLLHKSKDR